MAVASIAESAQVEQGWKVTNVDVALAWVAGWTTTARYPERLIAALSPGAVLLHHWDNFLRSIEHEARPLPAMQMAALVDRLRHTGCKHREAVGREPGETVRAFELRQRRGRAGPARGVDEPHPWRARRP